MKRFIFLTLALVLLLTACGGVSESKPEGTTAMVYYLGTDTAQALQGAEQSIDPDGDPVEQVLNALWKSPDTGQYTSVLPRSVVRLSVEEGSGKVTLRLSEAFGDLAVLERSLALAAIVHTLGSLDGVERVTVYAGETLVADELTADDLLLYDKEADPYERQVKVYFSDSSAKFLYSYTYLYTVGRGVDIEGYVLQELLRGAEDARGVVSYIPNETEVLNVYTESGICYVSLNDIFYTGMPDTDLERRAAVYAVVNSLTSIAGIDSVQFLRDGNAVESYGEIPLDAPLTLNKHIQGDSGTREGTAYLYCEKTEELTPIPIRTDAASGDTAVTAAINAALAAGDEAGYRSPIPDGTTLTSRPEVADRILTINLSGEFLDTGTAAETGLAVKAIAWPLSEQSGLDGIRVVVKDQDIIVDGFNFSSVIYFDEL